MKIINFLWWIGGPMFGAVCLGYAIAFAGWGLSAWARPEPDAFLLTIALLNSGLCSIKDGLKEISQVDK